MTRSTTSRTPKAIPGITVPQMREIYQAVHALPAPQREVLIAVDIIGLSYKEAARALRTKSGTVMSRLYRAREALAEQLRDVGWTSVSEA